MKLPDWRIFAPAFCLAFLSVASPSLAGGSPSPDDSGALFSRGLFEYRLERFDAARRDFLRLIASSPDSPRIPAAHVMLAKSLFRLGGFAGADSVVKSLRIRYPGAPYTDWTYYMEAACALRTGDMGRSLSLLGNLAANAHDPRIQSRSLRALKYTLLPVVGNARVDSILGKNGVAPRLLDAAEPYGIEETLDAEDELHIPAGSIPPPDAAISSIRIGLIAPLAGSGVEMGEYLTAGVRAAIPESLLIDGRPVQLLVETAGSEPAGAVLAARKLAKAGVSAIIGPVYSTPSISAAIEANAREIPFIAPTATETGMTDIGEYVFQLNPTPSIQGERLAGFAAEVLNARSVAIIASRDSWGENVAASFARVAGERGIRIVETAFFTPDAETDEDMKIVRNIRDHASKPPAFSDSAAVSDSAGPGPSYSSPALNPLNTVDAILISATPPDAVRFATRIMQYHLDTVLLGDSGWNTPGMPEEGKQFVEGAYLVAPSGILSGGRGAFFLENAGQNDIGGTVAMKGYDAGAILLRCLRSGARTPDEIARALGQIKNYRGASSLITIDPSRRVNVSVGFVRIHDQKYEMAPPVR